MNDSLVLLFKITICVHFWRGQSLQEIPLISTINMFYCAFSYVFRRVPAVLPTCAYTIVLLCLYVRIKLYDFVYICVYSYTTLSICAYKIIQLCLYARIQLYNFGYMYDFSYMCVYNYTNFSICAYTIIRFCLYVRIWFYDFAHILLIVLWNASINF